ncbi:MAG: Maf family protein [bacterium]
MNLILASGSKIRAQLLQSAGYQFSIIKSDLDESILKQQGQDSGAPIADIAMQLAIAKAKQISQSCPDSLVIGADQILGLDGQAYDKPETMQIASKRLSLFSGKSHFLYTACCVILKEKVIWQENVAPKLTMRVLSTSEIAAYLYKTGPEVLHSVGAYQLEKEGSRLFKTIEGDYFSILGLPLLSLHAFLRTKMDLPF